MDVRDAVQGLTTTEGRTDPYPIYEVLRAAAPVLQVDDGFVIVTGYAEADRLLRSPGFIVTDADALDRTSGGWRAQRSLLWLSRTMLANNPPDHGRLRRLAGTAFTARRVAALREDIVRLCAQLVDELAAAKAPVDFMTAFAYPLPVAVICALLGVPASDRTWFAPRASDLTLSLEAFNTGPTDMTKADVAAAELEDYFLALLADRKAHPGDDMISDLVRAGAAGEVGGGELIAHLSLLLVAGFETTTNLLGNGLAALLAHPAQRERLRALPALAPSYVEEMLRFDPPVQVTFRTAARHTELGECTLEAGTEVMVLLAAANRDPDYFPHPDRFDPDRPARQPLSFGAGVHYCLGAPLARLEAQVAFPMLMERLPALESVGEAVRRDRLSFRGFAQLPISAR
jgi:cytochrome P450